MSGVGCLWDWHYFCITNELLIIFMRSAAVRETVTKTEERTDRELVGHVCIF